MAEFGRRSRVTQIYPSLAKLLLLCFTIFSFFYFYQTTSFSDYIENHLAVRALFQVRDKLEKNPSLHPKIKLFSFDDTTLGRMGRPDFTIKEWSEILHKLAERKPKAIYIDKLFAQVDPASLELDQSIDAIKEIDIPIVTISFSRPRALRYREQVKLTDEKHLISSLYPEHLSMLREGFVPMADKRGNKVYGPDPKLIPVFEKLGHAHNAKFGRAQAFIQIGKKKILPHMTLMGPFPLEVRAQKLYVNGDQWIPLDDQGRMIVNFFDRSEYYKKNRRLLAIYDAVEEKKSLSYIKEGDVIVILPGMFTGGSDFVRTPLGAMPGGYIITSLLNSLVSDNWLQPSSWNNQAILLMCFIAGFFMFVPSTVSWMLFLGTIIVWILFCLVAFVFFDTMFHVSGPLTAFVTAAIVFVGFRDQVREKLVFFLRILKTENDQLRNEIDQAKEIARVFIPDETPEWQGVAFSTFNRPFVEASGDWFTFEKSDCGRYVHSILCDITGHGVQAAIIVSACKAVLSMVTSRERSLLGSEKFLEHYIKSLNSTLYAQGRGIHVSTLVGITIDIEKSMAYYVAAGHPSPIFFRYEEDSPLMVKQLTSRNNPLGFVNDTVAKVKSIQLSPGDSMMMFSDGVPFPRKAAKLKKLLEQRATRKIRSVSAENLVEALWGEKRKQEEVEIEDDQSLIWIQFKPEEFVKNLKQAS